MVIALNMWVSGIESDGITLFTRLGKMTSFTVDFGFRNFNILATTSGMDRYWRQPGSVSGTLVVSRPSNSQLIELKCSACSAAMFSSVRSG